MPLTISTTDFKLSVDADREEIHYIQAWHWNAYGLQKIEFLTTRYGCYADKNVNVIEGTVTKAESLEIVQTLAEVM